MILNLTQHNATQQQLDSGIVDFPENYKQALKGMLTFPAVYTRNDLETRANQINKLISEYYEDIVNNFGYPPNIEGVMIGGMPSFMPVLESALISKGIRVGYACTERQSVDKEIDGKVVKTAIFVHAGMYWAN